MKVTHNYNFLMQAPNGNDQLFKNVTFDEPHPKRFASDKRESPDCVNKHFCQTNTICKIEDIDEGISQSYHPTTEGLESGNVKATESESHKDQILPKVDHLEIVEGYRDVGHSSLHLREAMESNLENKLHDMPISSRHEIGYFYSKFETADAFVRKQVSRLYGKDIAPSHLFSSSHNGIGSYSKNYCSSLPLKLNDSHISNKITYPDISDASVKNSNSLNYAQEHKTAFEDRNNKSKDLNKNTIFKGKGSPDSNLHLMNAKYNLSVSKDECSVHCSSDSVSSFDEESQVSESKLQLFPHSLTKLNLCDICKKSFSTKGNLQNHHTVHSGQKPHECSVCQKTFSQRSTLGKHYLIHTGEKPHICNVCGRGFRQANNLRIHLLTHSGEKPHHCSVCEKGFTQKIALQKHMLTHTGVKPHECNVCKRCFTTKGNLQKHFLTHTGEKPHVCGICNRGFSQKIALKKHHLTHTGEKPFACDVCEKKFTTKGNLKSHFKRHTRDRFSAVASSSIASSLCVPKSIAESIMTPLRSQQSEQISSSPVSSPHTSQSLSGTKSALSTFSSQVQHPLLHKNLSLTSNMSSTTCSTASHKTQLGSCYFGHDEQIPLSSAVTYSQSSKLALTSFPTFQSQSLPTANHPAPFSSSQISQSVQPPMGNSIQKSILTNYLPPHAHKHVKAALPQHLQPSKNLCSEEPFRFSLDPASAVSSNARSSSPMQGSCNLSESKGEMFVKRIVNPTTSHEHNPSVHSASLHHREDMTVL